MRSIVNDINARFAGMYSNDAFDASRDVVRHRARSEDRKLSSGERNTAWAAALRAEDRLRQCAVKCEDFMREREFQASLDALCACEVDDREVFCEM